MTQAIVQFVVASGIVVGAAIALTRFSDHFARATGLGHLIVGSVFLAAATSLPELSVNWAIIQLNLPDMAVGGLVGSNLMNLGILAIADLSHRARGTVFSRKAVENALPGVVSIAMIAVVGIGIFAGDQLGSLEFGGFGLFAIVMALTYLLGLRLIYRDQLNNQPTSLLPDPPKGGQKQYSVVTSILGYVASAAVIIIAAPYSASSAGTIAEASGLGDTFVGTSLVAFATSLPELVTCIAAVRIGAMNLAIGNIFGSNTFNMLLLIPLDAAFPGALIGAVSTTHILTCLLVILVTAVVIIGQLYRVESRRLLVEPDAALVLLLVTIGLILIYFCR